MGALVDAVGAVVVAPNTILPALIHAGYEPIGPVGPAGPVWPAPCSGECDVVAAIAFSGSRRIRHRWRGYARRNDLALADEGVPIL